MLDARLDLDDLSKPLAMRGMGWTLGESFIESFASPQLESSLSEQGEHIFLWIGDDDDPHSGQDNLLGKFQKYSSCDHVEGVAIKICAAQQGETIELRRTYQGTFPLYVAATKQLLFLSWRFENVVAALKNPAPNLDACRNLLNHGECQVREQVISGTYMIWPGESLSFSRKGLEFQCAPARAIAAPTPVRDDAYVVDAFRELLQAELAKRLRRSKAPLIELSGGLDSSTLALAAGALRPGTFSYGLIQEGVMGKQQRIRRREIVTKANLADFEFPADFAPPFTGLANMSECSFVVFDDNHRPSCVAAIDAHPNGPFDLVITGIGGDELMFEDSYTRRDWEVAGTVSVSSVVAATARADMFLRRGIWPISPFCSLEIVDFCRALPRPYRNARMLIKMNFARLGISDGFIFPRHQEHYGHTMRHETAMVDFDELFEDSRVASYHILGLGSLLDEAREAHYDGFSYELMCKLWRVAKLDRVLSRYIQ